MDYGQESVTTNTDKAEKTRNRSAAYPAVDLEQAVQATIDLNKNLGEGLYSRPAAAEALGYAGVSGTSASKIASLVHFNLLNRQGDAYSLSELAKRIISPVSDEERAEAIAVAAGSPRLYSSLITEYSGKSLPVMLDNILFRNYRINNKVTKEVAKNFRKSLEFAGLLTNGVVKNLNYSEPHLQTQEIVRQIGLRDSESSTEEALSNNYQTIHLPSGVVVQFPLDMAYQVALGTFAKDLRSLNETASGITKPGENGKEVGNDKS